MSNFTKTLMRSGLLILLPFGSLSAFAAPVTYIVDPGHTYPSFEADHMGGLSLWRGKINSNSGKVILDTAAQQGSVTIEMEMNSIDFGHDDMNKVAMTDFFEVEKYPTALYVGDLSDFVNGSPTKVNGNLTLHGITKPVNLIINKFLCTESPMTGNEICGADAIAEFDRSEFGIDGGAPVFNMNVTIRISIEANLMVP